MVISQEARVHVSVLTIRHDHFVPRSICGGNHLNNRTVLILLQYLVSCSRPSAQAKCTALYGCFRTICIDHIYILQIIVLRDADLNTGCWSSRHRRSDDTSFRQSLPFAEIVNRMDQRQFPFSIERFCYGTGLWSYRPKTIIGKVTAIRRIDTNQGRSPLFLQTKSAARLNSAVLLFNG